MGLKENLLSFKSNIPDHVKLVAVSKTKSFELIAEAYQYGQSDFGENRAQELSEKFPLLPQDIQWHFIGHLQTNKVKYIASFVSMIHSVDSLKLLVEINKQALKNNRVIDCLLQFCIAKEISKFGLNIAEANEILSSKEFKELKNVRICGVMGMATFTNDNDIIRMEFRNLRMIYDQLKTRFFRDMEYFKEISMGMSDDYKIAIEEGSTMIRIGSAIFGERI